MNVGYVGLGAMGKILASHLVGAYPLQVWDINSDAREHLASLGANIATSLADLGANCQLIILCLPKSAHVEQVLFADDGLASSLKAGSIVVDQTSGDPSMTQSFAARLALQGVDLIDAPIAGGIPAAHAREISIMMSGARDAVSHAIPVLEKISPHLYPCGNNVGSAQTLKSINNSINSVNRLATLEITAMARRLGVPFRPIMEVLDADLSKSFLTERLLGGIAQQKPSTDFGITGMLKDVGLAANMARAHGIARPLNDAARNVLAMSLSCQGGDARLEDLIAFTEQLMGIKFLDEGSDPSINNVLLAGLPLALQAVHAVAVLENLHLLQGLGVDFSSAGLVLANGSAGSVMLQMLFKQLNGESVAPLATINEWIAALDMLVVYANKQDVPLHLVTQTLCSLQALAVRSDTITIVDVLPGSIVNG